ncbi:hypothetical protein O3M35_009649 [Rhynocoris fuscipes]|uniref:Uncharacterized protein n=1 Tax=Rhynocoris fuscipes TaxID=488301 RepID=A0AAW1D9M5_9HEMI
MDQTQSDQLSSKETICKVCGDKASGKHYGVPSCDGCRGFFKRSIRRKLKYVCKEDGRCVVDVTRRNQCQACRFSKCLQVNMKKDAVQHERAPRTNIQHQHMSHVQQPHSPYHNSSMPVLYPATAFLQPLHRPYLTSAPIGLSYLPSIYLRSETHHLSGTNMSHTSLQTSPTCNEDEVTSSQELAGDTKLSSTLSSLNVISTENLYDAAAKLLALTVSCVRAIPSYQQLSCHDRTILLEDSWKDLFILTIARLISGCGIEDHDNQLSCDAHRVASVVTRLSQLRADHTEFACLKALLLFKPDTVENSRHEVEILQEQTHLMLREYSGPRFSKLVLTLLTISRISIRSILALFFRQKSHVKLDTLLATSTAIERGVL